MTLQRASLREGLGIGSGKAVAAPVEILIRVQLGAEAFTGVYEGHYTSRTGRVGIIY